MENIFAERLKQIRESLQWTQNELGTRAGLPATSIAHFENGSRKPSFDTLRRLATALEVSTDYLLGTTDKRISTPTGDEPTLMPTANALFRNFEKLSGNDRELLQGIAEMLAGRNIKNE
jgi:transcriptional regulator with XRE-family HTH domain